MEAKILLTK